MVYYDKTDDFEGIDVKKMSLLVFLDKGFRFQPTACNGCYDILMMSIYIKNITILNISGLDNCCIVVGISKSEAIN